jgi:hypothetical protein
MPSLNRLFAVLGIAFLLLSTPLLAAPAATVEAVQSPAWRERGGVSVPLAAGMELKGGDVLRTGPGARAYLLLAEGSRVKLGEEARFAFNARSPQPDRIFRGALDVLVGAFRFTTAALAKARPRDLAIRVGTATIGIRGTDLWGRADGDGELVALLEGRIGITRAGETVELTQPLTFFEASTGKAAEVKPLDPEVFRKLARQTEILAGDGASRAAGRWRLLVAVAANEAAALEVYDRVRAAGFAAQLRPRRAEGEGSRYEVLVGRYASPAEAGVAAASLQAATGLNSSAVR